MASSDKGTQKTLSNLYEIVEAGERGYATAATNIKNRGSKLLLKSFAQQRARFKEEIQSELRRHGVQSTIRSSIFGMIHRGRVAIFAAMTIDSDQRERVVLKEAALGERYAVQAYQRALAADLPAGTRAMVERQFQELRQTVDEIHRMLGRDGKSMVVQLYDSEKDADLTIRSLEDAGFPVENVEKVEIDPSTAHYEGKGTTVFETILSGMFGGFIWGSLIGVLAGFGAVQTNTGELIGMNSIIGMWVLIAVATVILAVLLGGILGFFIGVGISEDDQHDYRNSTQHGRYLIKALVDTTRMPEARRILNRESLSLSYASG